ncbi:MAG TPA: MFS transporter [Steroidobacteraceae bacterium]
MQGAEQSRSSAAGGRYAWYVLGVLFLVYAVNLIDRQILSILAQDIKADLGASDAQLGFLYGTAFAIFYSLFGIPLGRLADGWHRTRLIALGLALWSGLTALSGFAGTFGQLAAARVGVGVGEASASPAAYSLLADYFPREQRGLALAIYSAGALVGLALSLPIGGAIAHAWTSHFAVGNAPLGLAGWQAAFLAVGVPGLLMAAWALTLREPPRGLADGHPLPARRPGVWRDFAREVGSILPPFTLWSVARIPGGLRVNLLLLVGVGAAAAAMARLSGDALQWSAIGVGAYATGSWAQQLRATDRPTFVLLWGTPAAVLALLSCGFLAFMGYALAFWVPPYAMRTFHIASDVAGLKIGVPQGLAAAAGVIFAGRVSDAWKRHEPRARIYLCMLTMILSPPLVYATLSVGDAHTLYLLNPLAVFVVGSQVGNGAAMIQDCVLPRMRGTAGATYLLVFSLLGLALGPYCVGKVSGLTGSLRLGMLSIFVMTPAALLVMWQAARRLPLAEASKVERAREAGERASDT